MLHRDDRPSTSARSLELRELYEAFNAREIDRILAAMTSDVQWPNGWEGGHLEGRASVRDYWIRQWAQFFGCLSRLFSGTGRRPDRSRVQTGGSRPGRFRPCSRGGPPCVRVRGSSGPSHAGRAVVDDRPNRVTVSEVGRRVFV
ncbi:nuclear transport factor 2 family protein [Streptomyces sp. TSRI0445]|uniref:nuclear transport factor 2 family protein n=1 Tax=Streptomyces sp. TSRI0445 TaxID=1703925 RepID=UPI0018E931A2